MADLLKVSLEGQLPGGEVFSVNPVWSFPDANTAVTFAELTAAVAGINALTIPSPVLNMITSGCAWTGCRIEARVATGVLEVLAEGSRTSPVAGTGASDKAFQTSMVTSLRTTFPGASGRGRLYWPATGVGVAPATLRVVAGDVTTFLGGVKSYLTAIEGVLDAQVDPGLRLAVWSRTRVALEPVNSITMGDILDTQRRRRDGVSESHTATSWP